jgi:lipopolysaccharide/colanic/teichoic acid biosynthesis glycosyltransferase
MSKQPLNSLNLYPGRGGLWQLASRRLVSAAAVLILIFLAWLLQQQVIPPGRMNAGWAILLVVLAAVLTMAAERGLVSLPLTIGWRYRLAFLGSAAVFLALGLLTWLSAGADFSAVWLLAALLGSFAGGILATHLNEGLWENNSPPSEEVTRAVYLEHRQLIGSPARVPVFKRSFDILLAAIGLLLSLPIWFIIIFITWLEDPGPLLFVKNSVGRGGMNFHQYKLRTMVRGAEDTTGPVLASARDERVLGMGSLLRKTALDELPQLINILQGKMSFVGPRPQRTVLVQGYLKEMPEYAQRHRVLPGLAGLAQVAGDYYLTPRQKLRFDRLYIQYTSLGFDLKLISLAFMITFWYRWHADWDGRLPRRLLRMGGSAGK